MGEQCKTSDAEDKSNNRLTVWIFVQAQMLVPAFHIFEFTVGVYFPIMSSLKAELIPDDSRAAVMSLLRVPMNIGVCTILWQVRK